jgi:hypothetical protein
MNFLVPPEGHGRNEDCSSHAGSREAIARPPFCRFPAPGSSAVDSQRRERLQLPVRDRASGPESRSSPDGFCRACPRVAARTDQIRPTWFWSAPEQGRSGCQGEVPPAIESGNRHETRENASLRSLCYAAVGGQVGHRDLLDHVLSHEPDGRRHVVRDRPATRSLFRAGRVRSCHSGPRSSRCERQSRIPVGRLCRTRPNGFVE